MRVDRPIQIHVALLRSVAAWDHMVRLAHAEEWAELLQYWDRYNCPLCVVSGRFGLALRLRLLNCDGCPVFVRTSKTSCYGTPFWRAYEMIDNVRCDLDIGGPITQLAAAPFEDEAAFLRSLI